MENSNTPPTAPVPASPPTVQLENDGGVRPSPGAAVPERGQGEFVTPGRSNLAATEDGHTPSKTKSSEWRKPLGVIISLVVIVGAVVLTLCVWNVMERHPRTDDAIARANVVG